MTKPTARATARHTPELALARQVKLNTERTAEEAVREMFPDRRIEVAVPDTALRMAVNSVFVATGKIAPANSRITGIDLARGLVFFEPK